MDCNTCNELLAEYKLWVTVFKDAVLNIPGALGNDSRVFVEHADRLRLKCNEASRALRLHFREKHGKSKAAFSEPCNWATQPEC